MRHPRIDGGLCPVCVTGEVLIQLDITLVPTLAECQDCGHRFDPLKEDSK